MLDKTMSITFNKPACLPDTDIDSSVVEENFPRIWLCWVELAKILSVIQRRLYSAAGINKERQQREEIAVELASHLHNWWDAYQKQIIFGGGIGVSLFPEDCVRLGVLMLYHNALIKVHRSTGDPGFPAVLQYSRASLRYLQQALTETERFHESTTFLW